MVKRLVQFSTALALLSLLLAGAPTPSVHAIFTVLYVVPGGSGGCTSWADGCGLHTALGLAAVNDRVWVKAGVYIPGATQSDYFDIPAGVAVYGGFNGTETAVDARDPGTNVTILSGDIGNDDAHHTTTNIDLTTGDIAGNNAYHVVKTEPTIAIIYTTVLDGFTITGGQATGSLDDSRGGGLICKNPLMLLCSPRLVNLVVIGNGGGLGGGMYIDSGGATASPILVNVTFQGNSASSGGGGMYNIGATPSLDNVTFVGNTSASGGAIYNGGGSPSLANVTFSGNSATTGGAIYDNGSTPALTNVTFSGNTATTASGQGGAMWNVNSSPTLVNAIMWADTAGLSNPEIGNSSGASVPTISYSVVQGSGGSGGGWDTGLGTDGAHNLDADPKLGGLSYNGGFTPTMPLLIGSHAIDAGFGSTCAAAPVNNLDQRGYIRSVDGDNNGSVVCDIGAFEFSVAFAAVAVHGSTEGNYIVPSRTHTHQSYAGVNDGPMKVWSTNGMNLVASARVIVGGTSYSEMMGYPGNKLTDDFWFPWYNNVAFSSQLRVSNLGGSSTTVTVTYGSGTPLDGFTLAAGAASRTSYAGINSGPLHVTSSGAISILTTIRVVYGGGSYSEMTGYPNNQLTDEFWFPWYNNVAFSSQLRVSNLGGSSTTVTVTYGNGTPLDSFTLAAGAASRTSYAGINNGPLHVTSSGAAPILSTIRVVYGGGSYSEMMGYPGNQLTDEYWFPVYDNVGVGSQLRVSNVGPSATTVKVYTGDSSGSYALVDTFPLAAGAAVRTSYAGVNQGPLHVVSSGGVPILPTVRTLYGGTSYFEMIGYRATQLTDTYWFPYYNNVALSTELRFAVP